MAYAETTIAANPAASLDAAAISQSEIATEAPLTSPSHPAHATSRAQN